MWKTLRRSCLIPLLAAGSLAALVTPAAAQNEPIDLVATETFRAQMIEVGEIYEELGARLRDPRAKSGVSDLEKAAAGLVLEAQGMRADDVALLTAAGVDLSDFLAAARNLREVTDAAARTAGLTKTAGFPDADYGFLCGDTRPDPTVVVAATIALEAAKAIWSAADRGCNQTVVVLGEGGNTSLVCIVADAALFVAEKALETYKGCRETINAQEIGASYQRLGHLHDDLAQAATADAQASIEQNLMLAAPTQNIATFQLPLAFGGQLETVAIVVQTAMDNMTAAGQSINFAQTFFDQAQTLAANGEYKRAYLMYKRAYQEVVKLP